MTATASHSSVPATLPDGERIVRRAARRLIPFLFLLYLVNYLDRANISFTKKPMQADLKLTDAQSGFAAGIFFIGYALLEVPSNLAMARVGARRWIARIVFSWGLIATLMVFAHGITSFAVLRLLLGCAEAGFMPGIILYLTRWFPAGQRAKAYALFLTSIALSGVIGSPLSGYILRLNGVWGLAGWQWVLLLEGLACVPLGVLTLCYLPERPSQARWLAPEDARWLEETLRSEHGAAQGHSLGHALRSGRVWMLATLYFLLISGLFGFIFWAPALIKDTSGGWWTAVPYLAAAVGMVLISRSSDATGKRRLHVAGSAVVGAIGIAATVPLANTPAAVLTLSVAAIGIWGCLGPFWALPTSFLRGDAAVAGIAVINSVGCTAGFFTPWVIGLIKQRRHDFTGLYLVAGALLLAAILVLSAPKSGDRMSSPVAAAA